LADKPNEGEDEESSMVVGLKLLAGKAHGLFGDSGSD